MNSQTPILTEDASYIDEVTATLRNLLRQVIKTREPEVLPIIDSPEAAAAIPAHLVEHALQAIGIWLQLMNIAEENAASTQQVSAASEEQTASMIEIASASEGLSQLANELQRSIDKFGV